MDNKKVDISYEALWKAIIRPPRDEYEEEDLGDPEFKFRNREYKRKDYNIISSEGYILKASLIEPKKEFRPFDEMPVVIYCHGNSSSRLEGLRMVIELLKHDINLFVFDFAGCGLSEGDYISLGYHEKEDLRVIVDFVERIPGVGRIGLWGRSMGAATSMIYSHKDERIFATCLDSPFSDFYQLSKELVLKQSNKIPNFIIDTALSILRKTIKSKNGLDISKLRPIDAVSKTKTPLFFIHAINDELISFEHTVKLSVEYKGEPNFAYIEKGGHNSPRPRDIFDRVGKFFTRYLYPNDEYAEELNQITQIHTDKILSSIETVEAKAKGKESYNGEMTNELNNQSSIDEKSTNIASLSYEKKSNSENEQEDSDLI